MVHDGLLTSIEHIRNGRASGLTLNHSPWPPRSSRPPSRLGCRTSHFTSLLLEPLERLFAADSSSCRPPAKSSAHLEGPMGSLYAVGRC